MLLMQMGIKPSQCLSCFFWHRGKEHFYQSSNDIDTKTKRNNDKKASQPRTNIPTRLAREYWTITRHPMCYRVLQVSDQQTFLISKNKKNFPRNMHFL